MNISLKDVFFFNWIKLNSHFKQAADKLPQLVRIIKVEPQPDQTFHRCSKHATPGNGSLLDPLDRVVRTQRLHKEPLFLKPDRLHERRQLERVVRVELLDGDRPQLLVPLQEVRNTLLQARSDPRVQLEVQLVEVGVGGEGVAEGGEALVGEPVVVEAQLLKGVVVEKTLGNGGGPGVGDGVGAEMKSGEPSVGLQPHEKVLGTLVTKLGI